MRDSVGIPVADTAAERLGVADITPVKEVKIDAELAADELPYILGVFDANPDILSSREVDDDGEPKVEKLPASL